MRIHQTSINILFYWILSIILEKCSLKREGVYIYTHIYTHTHTHTMLVLGLPTHYTIPKIPVVKFVSYYTTRGKRSSFKYNDKVWVSKRREGNFEYPKCPVHSIWHKSYNSKWWIEQIGNNKSTFTGSQTELQCTNADGISHKNHADVFSFHAAQRQDIVTASPSLQWRLILRSHELPVSQDS
jgi:hypothetical protein